MLLTFTSFFFEKFIQKHFTFFKKNVNKLKKVKMLVISGSKKTTGKCQQHETNMILCLLHATDIYQFFFEKFIQKHFTFFKKNINKLKKSKDVGYFWFKRKTGKCQKHETNMILCLLHATDIYQFFFERFIQKHFTFFKKNVEKMKKKDVGNFWFKKKLAKVS